MKKNYFYIFIFVLVIIFNSKIFSQNEKSLVIKNGEINDTSFLSRYNTDFLFTRDDYFKNYNWKDKEINYIIKNCLKESRNKNIFLVIATVSFLSGIYTTIMTDGLYKNATKNETKNTLFTANDGSLRALLDHYTASFVLYTIAGSFYISTIASHSNFKRYLKIAKIKINNRL